MVHPNKVTKSIIVKGDVKEIFSLWANFENFPYFMKNIKSVHKMEDGISHWVMGSRVGKDLEWDAETTDLQENRRIAWSSISGDIKTSGQVSFAPLDHNETEVTAQVQYIPPAGQLGKMLAHLFENPDKKIEEDLKQFKKYAEKQYQKV
jgi:uncharacterized membrane protein